MKVKLNDLLNAVGQNEGFSKLLNVNLRAKISYKISHLVFNDVESHRKAFDKENLKLYKKYGEIVMVVKRDEKGQPMLDENEVEIKEATDRMQLKPENIIKYNEEVAELLDMEKSIWFEPIKLSELKIDLKEIELTPLDMRRMMPFLIYDIDEEETQGDNIIVEEAQRDNVTAEEKGDDIVAEETGKEK